MERVAYFEEKEIYKTRGWLIIGRDKTASIVGPSFPRIRQTFSKIRSNGEGEICKLFIQKMVDINGEKV